MLHVQTRIDFRRQTSKILLVGGEDRALLGSNLSARTDDGASAGDSLLPSLLLPLMPCPQSDKPMNVPDYCFTFKPLINPTGLPFGNISGVKCL